MSDSPHQQSDNDHDILSVSKCKNDQSNQNDMDVDKSIGFAQSYEEKQNEDIDIYQNNNNDQQILAMKVIDPSNNEIIKKVLERFTEFSKKNDPNSPNVLQQFIDSDNDYTVIYALDDENFLVFCAVIDFKYVNLTKDLAHNRNVYQQSIKNQSDERVITYTTMEELIKEIQNEFKDEPLRDITNNNINDECSIFFPQKTVSMKWYKMSDLINRRASFERLEFCIDLDLDSNVIPVNGQVRQIIVNGSRGSGKSTFLYSSASKYVQKKASKGRKCAFNITFHNSSKFIPDFKEDLLEKYPIASRLMFHYLFKYPVIVDSDDMKKEEEQKNLLFVKFQEFLNEVLFPKKSLAMVYQSNWSYIKKCYYRSVIDCSLSQLFLNHVMKELKCKCLVFVDEIMDCRLGFLEYRTNHDTYFKPIILNTINQIQDSLHGNVSVVISSMDPTITQQNYTMSRRGREFIRLGPIDWKSANERYQPIVSKLFEKQVINITQREILDQMLLLTYPNPRTFSLFLCALESKGMQNLWKSGLDHDIYNVIMTFIKNHSQFVFHDTKVDVLELIINTLCNGTTEVDSEFAVPQSLGLFNMSSGKDAGMVNIRTNMCYLFAWAEDYRKHPESYASSSFSKDFAPILSKLFESLKPCQTKDFRMFEVFHRYWEELRFLFETKEYETTKEDVSLFTDHYNLDTVRKLEKLQSNYCKIDICQNVHYSPQKLHCYESKHQFKDMQFNEHIVNDIKNQRHFIVYFHKDCNNVGYDLILFIYSSKNQRYEIVLINLRYSKNNNNQRKHETSFDVCDLFSKSIGNRAPDWLKKCLLKSSNTNFDDDINIDTEKIVPQKKKDGVIKQSVKQSVKQNIF